MSRRRRRREGIAYKIIDAWDEVWEYREAIAKEKEGDRTSKSFKQSYSSNRYCPNCNRIIPEDARCCPYCSKKFEEF